MNGQIRTPIKLSAILLLLSACSAQTAEPDTAEQTSQEECDCAPNFYFESVLGSAFVMYYQPFSTDTQLSFVGSSCGFDESLSSLSSSSELVVKTAIGYEADGTPNYGIYAVDLETSESVDEGGVAEILKVNQFIEINIETLAEDVRAAGQCVSANTPSPSENPPTSR